MKSAPRVQTKLSRTARIVRGLSVANLIAVGGVWTLLHIVSERWWFSSALTYLPRIPYALPALLLLAGTLCWHRRSAWWNLIAVGVVLGPIAGFQIPGYGSPIEAGPGSRLKVVSCNVQDFEPDFAVVMEEVGRLKPDIVAFQEVRGIHPLIATVFRDWHTLSKGEFWIGSKYPIRWVSECESKATDRPTAIKVEVDSPAGPFLLSNVHLSTARHGLIGLKDFKSILTGDAPSEVEDALEVRNQEAATTRAFVSEGELSIPALVVGDLNIPTSSSFYQAYWADLTNAFDEAGWGFGYTGPCSRRRFWPDYVPWIRIDHILATSQWQILECDVGKRNGSDHRLVAATLVLRTGDAVASAP